MPIVEPPETTLLRWIGGYRVSQAMYVVAELGVVDALESGGPTMAAELARGVGAHPDRLYRVLRALAAIGLFRVDDRGRFCLTDTSRLLRRDSAGSMALAARFAGSEAYRAWGDLLHAVKTGETSFDHAFGMGHFDYLSRNPEAAKVFNELMAWSVRVEGDPLAEFDLSGRRVLVDVGGGGGSLIASALRTHPGLHGVLFDLAPAVAGARELFEREGVQDRCEIRVGSAFDGIPPGGDAYVLSRILHDWPDEKALRLLQNCRRAMREDAILLILDGVLPSVDPPPSRAWLDLVMMVMNGGRERTEEEWRTLLSKAGFRLADVRKDRTDQDLLVAHPV